MCSILTRFASKQSITNDTLLLAFQCTLAHLKTQFLSFTRRDNVYSMENLFRTLCTKFYQKLLSFTQDTKDLTKTFRLTSYWGTVYFTNQHLMFTSKHSKTEFLAQTIKTRHLFKFSATSTVYDCNTLISDMVEQLTLCCT